MFPQTLLVIVYVERASNVKFFQNASDLVRTPVCWCTDDTPLEKASCTSFSPSIPLMLLSNGPPLSRARELAFAG